MQSDARAHILETMRVLTIRAGALPSMDAVAKAAGVSKGGLTHHFPSRPALLSALVEMVGWRTTETFERSRATRPVSAAYLETSMPDSGELDDFFVLFTCYQALRAAGVHGDPAFEAFITDLTRDLTAELGDPFKALVVRLVGDGLLLNAVMGTPVPGPERDALIEHFSAGRPTPSAATTPESTS
ncbi:TetR/AcrR family transcriptional regulator [Herbiconiux sp. P15]|uniref:TetR/AcrR family transcriptional regulator n=1 Tax=Herbiconiux liukaitaii TaxID=3342799 RepID=UPI0035BA74CB